MAVLREVLCVLYSASKNKFVVRVQELSLCLPLYCYSYPFLPAMGGEIVTTDRLARAAVLSWVCPLLFNLDQSLESRRRQKEKIKKQKEKREKKQVINCCGVIFTPRRP